MKAAFMFCPCDGLRPAISTYSIAMPRSTPIEDVRLHVRMAEKRDAPYGLDFPHRNWAAKLPAAMAAAAPQCEAMAHARFRCCRGAARPERARGCQRPHRHR